MQKKPPANNKFLLVLRFIQSRKTVSHDCFTAFLRFVSYEFHLQKLQSISGKHISAYVDYVQHKGYAASTVKTDLAVMRIDTAIARNALKNEFITIKGKGEIRRVFINESIRIVLKQRLETTPAGQKFIAEGKTDSEAKRMVSQLLGHEREDVIRIYFAGIN